MMKFINYFFALYFLIYGLLISFKVVPMDLFTVGCMAVISSMNFIRNNF
jgi:hypothetical protein